MGRTLGKQLVLVAAISCLASGCPKAAPKLAAGHTGPAGAKVLALAADVTAAVALAADATATPLPVAATVTLSEVDGLVQSWLNAQNTGDFAAYAKLYADKMTGMRRVGQVARSFGRAGWMADRKRMFAKAMVVRASDVAVSIQAGVAQVRFTQHFASGNFADVGPKQWVVVPSRNGPRIAKEEMQLSVVQDGQAPPQVPASEMIALAVHAAGKAWLVVGERAGQPAGPATLLQRQGPAVASKALPWSEALWSWRQRDVVLYGKGGELCRGQVQAIAALARVVPHFGTTQLWQGQEVGRPLPDAEVAAQIWDLADETTVAAVEVQAYQGDCAGALWGRAANLPSVAILARDATKAGALREASLDALRKAKIFSAIARDFASEVAAPRPANWDQFGNAVTKVTSLEGSGVRIVATWAKAGEGCGGFYGEMIAIWLAVPAPGETYALQLASDPNAAGLVMPEVAADVDGDGVFELIGPGQLWRRAGATWRPALTLVVPNFDCPC